MKMNRWEAEKEARWILGHGLGHTKPVSVRIRRKAVKDRFEIVTWYPVPAVRAAGSSWEEALARLRWAVDSEGKVTP